MRHHKPINVIIKDNILILPNYFGETGVWISFPIADVLSTIVTGIFLNREIRTKLIPKSSNLKID